jgi:hypothetical protein
MIVLKPDFIRKLGAQMVTLIVKRTQSGMDITDKKFKAYSTRPFAMPAGAINRRTLKALDQDEQITYFKTKIKSTWVIVEGGYATYKRYLMKNATSSGGVNLTITGSMLRSMNVKSTGENSLIIGFNRTEEAEKAMWNINKGRNFFGLSPNDISKLAFKSLEIQSVNIKVS